MNNTKPVREKPGKTQPAENRMNPQKSAKIPTQKPHTRVGGSIPSRATSSQTKRAAGKPGKKVPKSSWRWAANELGKMVAEETDPWIKAVLLRAQGAAAVRALASDKKGAKA